MDNRSFGRGKFRSCSAQRIEYVQVYCCIVLIVCYKDILMFASISMDVQCTKYKKPYNKVTDYVFSQNVRMLLLSDFCLYQRIPYYLPNPKSYPQFNVPCPI